MVKINLNKKKFPSQKRNKSCRLCKNNNRKYSSSSLGRHIRTKHGQKYQCNFCLKKFTDKNNHKICFIQEKFFLKNFIEDIQGKTIHNVFPSITNFPPQLSNIFIDNDSTLLCPKLKLGEGHFSKVFFGIDKSTKIEIAIKIPKDSSKINDYQEEGRILNLLQSKNFYPKLYQYKESLFVDRLNMTLHGPNLLDLFHFSEGFDKKTIINICENLLKKIKYMNERNIIHRDIKPENIVWGIVNNGKIDNKNELYFIDFGFSFQYNEPPTNIESKIISYRRGTPLYMAINNHKNLFPSTIDDIESLLYTLMKLANINLPWINVITSGRPKHDIYADLKENIDVCALCGKEYELFSKIYIYLKMVREKKQILNFDVLFEFINESKIKEFSQGPKYEEKYIFIEKLKLKLNDLRITGKNIPQEVDLIKLFYSYPIDYIRLLDSLNK